MNRMDERGVSDSGTGRAAAVAMLLIGLVALGGCATTGGAGGGLVPTRGSAPASAQSAAPRSAAENPVNPIANDPATAGADDVPIPPATPVPEVGQVIGSTASGGKIMERAVVDSGPSADARAVLATIPEPIPASEQVPPSARVQQLHPLRDATPGRNAAADTLGMSDLHRAAPTDSVSLDAGGVPIPERTLPLGERRPQTIPIIPDSVLRAMADTARKSATAPPAPAPAETPSPAASSPAVPDTCWRVQVAAPEEAERAEQLRTAAESLLLVPMVVEAEKGLHKVRTRDCLSGKSAGNLRERAESSGFEGSFRFMRKP